MHLESISLNNFKNYESAKVHFCNEINCFVGKNGSGKTNRVQVRKKPGTLLGI